MKTHRTITGRILNLNSLKAEEKRVLKTLLSLYKSNMDWADFSNRRQKELKKVLFHLKPLDRFKHPLYRTVEDLELRLGISQGHMEAPGYRDYLVEAIEEKYGTRYRFCKETDISPSMLSQVLSGKKDFSLSKLEEIAGLLNLKLVLLPLEEIENSPAYS